MIESSLTRSRASRSPTSTLPPAGPHARSWTRSSKTCPTPIGSTRTGRVDRPRIIQRRLLHGDRWLRAGYVEGVAVRPDRRGRGHGAAMMEALERVVRNAYDLGALGATEEGAVFYAARGWQRWRGPCSALTPIGIRRTEDEQGCIYVLPVATPLDLSGELICDWRDGDLW